MHDGAGWIYYILQKGYFFDYGYWRRFSLVIESPFMLIKYLFPLAPTKLLIAVCDFSFQCHPIISLIACWTILIKADRLDLIVFPALSYSLATLSTIGFAVGVVPESLSLFWPLLLLMTLFDELSWVSLSISVILILALAFTYEFSTIFIVLLAGIKLLRLKSNLSLKGLIVLATLGLAQVFIFFRVFGPNAANQTFFWASIKSPLFGFREYSLITLLFFSISIIPQRLPTRIRKLGLILFSVISLWYFVLFSRDGVILGSEYIFRVSAIPTAFFIAVVFVLYVFKFNQKNVSDVTIGIVFFSIIVCSFHDFQYTNLWKQEWLNFKSKYANAKGCIEIQPKPGDFFHGWAIPYNSILAQESQNISYVVFDTTYVKENFCEKFRKGRLSDGYSEAGIQPPRYFNYSSALSFARQTHF